MEAVIPRTMDGRRSSAGCLGVMLASVCLLAGRAYAGVAVTAPDSVTGLYIPGWADNRNPNSLHYFNTSAVNLQGVSHFYYAFLWIRNATYEVYDPFGNLNLLVELKSRWPSSKFLLSIGGGGFNLDIWAKAATVGLDSFVESIIRAIKTSKADGVDIDWEAPDKNTRTAYTNLCARLRARLDAEGAAASPPRKYWLTAATGAFVTPDSFAGFDLAALKTTVDLFNIMAYELHDPCYWETKTHFHTAWSDCAKALDYYIAQGVPRLQLVLGLAFYGHQYTLTDPSSYMYPAPSVELRQCGNQVTPSYRDVMRELQSGVGGGVFVDAAERSAYYVRDVRWVGFDIPETMALKVQGSREYGLAGVMIWDASLDVPEGTLLRSVADRWTNTTRPCGGGYIGTGRCSNSAQCCSEFGYCGVGDKYCGYRCRGGPCIQYPSPPPKPPAPPPACGNGVVGGGRCTLANECCSSAGWCGTGEPWCGSNCMGGPCWYKPKSPPLPPSPPPSPAPPPPPPLPYGCGGGVAGNGTCPNPNDCCSAFGWCANTPTHCGPGCKGGPCIPYPPPPPGEGGPLCGDGNVGNKRCLYPDQCCSKYGYCANDADHCTANACVGGPCWAPPPAPQRSSSPPRTMPPSPTSPSPRSQSPSPSALKPPSPKPPSPPPPPPPSPNPSSPKPPPPRSPSPSPKPPSSPKPPPPPSPPPQPANQGFCGNGRVGNGTCQDPKSCCSAAGWCGVNEDACYWYCIGGPCWEPPPPPSKIPPGAAAPPSPPPPAPGFTWCGDGVVGNKTCRLKHLCCSAAGWCAYTADHCLNYCAGGPCWKPPPPAPILPPNATAGAPTG